MPDAILGQWCTYPGVPDFDSASYSCTHGISPGVVIATTKIPPDYAAPVGPFVISDGTRSITLRDCKYQRREGRGGMPGSVYTMTLLDRRWRWAFGSISGSYNLKDDKGNLVPWTARTPTQLARLCLERMGETGYLIDLPDGIGADQLDQTRDNPAPGQMTPPTGTNPTIEWVDEVPAVALARLCDTFGRRVIFDPVRDIVVIARPGDGAELPVDGFLRPNISYGVDAYEKPRGVGVVGDKVKYQMRLKLIPVGLEWDGRIVPIEELSYRPRRTPQPGQWTITITEADAGPFTLIATVGGVSFGALVENSANDLATRVASLINGNETLASRMIATVNTPNVVTVTGRHNGEVIAFAMAMIGDNATVKVVNSQKPTKSAWDLSVPGDFGDVQPTSRLTYFEAKDRAMQSVYRWYRVVSDDISSGWDNFAPKKIFVPYFGEVDRRQNLEILPDKVEQVVPEAVNPALLDPVLGIPTATMDYYNGYSRDRQAVVYGAICSECVGRWYHQDRKDNTPEGSAVGVPFTVDSANQMVIFNAPVFKIVNTSGTTQRDTIRRAANLCLETGVHVLDNQTYAAVRYKRWIDFGPREPGSENRDRSIEVDLTKYGIKKAKPYTVKLPRRRENVGSNDVPADGIQWYGHADDLKMGVIGYYQYDAAADRHTLVSASADEFEKRFQDMADSYLVGHILEHQLEDGQTASYRGIHPRSLDGAVMQVSWSIGSDGALTVASRNHTHGFLVLPYPAKRKEENLEADAGRAALNLRSRPGDAILSHLERASKFAKSVIQLFRS